MEEKNVIEGDVVAFTEKTLSEYYESIAKSAASVIVATAFEVITKYRSAGMSWHQIEQAFALKSVPVKADSLRKMYLRAEKTRARLRAGAGGQGQEKIVEPLPDLPAPPLVEPELAVAETVAVAKPVEQKPASAKPAMTPAGAALAARIEADKARISEEHKVLMRRILDEIPAPDREYTDQLKQLRFWTAPDGRTLDVQGPTPADVEADPDLRRQLQMATVRYANARRAWLTAAGVCVVGGSGALIIAYERAKMPPLTIDLKETVTAHLN